MSGTIDGGLQAAQTNKAKYGQDFYRRIGAIGGKKGTTGGFYANRELARRAGKLGGTISRRGPSKSSALTKSSALVVDAPLPFVVDDSEFTEGFNAPTWKDKLLRRLR